MENRFYLVLFCLLIEFFYNFKDYDEIEQKLLENDKCMKRYIAPENGKIDVSLIFYDIIVHGLVNRINFIRFFEQVLRTNVKYQILYAPSLHL